MVDLPTRKQDLKPKHLAIFVLAVLAIAAFLAAYNLGLFQTAKGGGEPGLMGATCSSVSASGPTAGAVGVGNASHVYFLIVEADPGSVYEGMNGSAIKEAGNLSIPWPVMRVHLGQVVSIHVINCASSESHGFAVQHYDEKSVNAVQPGGHYDVTFVADTKGTFRVYCDIFCAIHVFMQNGQLVVS